jgi:hypothetical protein
MVIRILACIYTLYKYVAFVLSYSQASVPLLCCSCTDPSWIFHQKHPSRTLTAISTLEKDDNSIVNNDIIVHTHIVIYTLYCTGIDIALYRTLCILSCAPVCSHEPDAGCLVLCSSRPRTTTTAIRILLLPRRSRSQYLDYNWIQFNSSLSTKSYHFRLIARYLITISWTRVINSKLIDQYTLSTQVPGSCL